MDSLPNSRSSTDQSEAENYLQYFSHQAMGCQFATYFRMGEYENAPDVSFEGFDLVDTLESKMTTYRPSSEVSCINNGQPGVPISVSKDVIDVLISARKISEETQGAFDITAGILSEIWKHAKRIGNAPKQAEILSALNSIGSDVWSIDDKASTATRLDALSTLDLGAIGKGYALDAVKELLHQNEITNFLIHGGNSSVVASGFRHDSNQETGWTIGVSHPVYPDQRVAEIFIKDQAIGTSGTRRQGFILNGQWFGHIIDPRTGQPGSKTLSSTVITKSAAVADALATAFYVMSLDEIESFCTTRPHVSAMIVAAETPGRTQSTRINAKMNFSVHTYNLASDSFQLLEQRSS